MITLCCEALAKQYGNTVERNAGWRLQFENSEGDVYEVTIFFCPFCGFKLQDLNTLGKN